MDVSGSNTRLWINEREGRDGNTWKDYSIGISKKREDGEYDTLYLKVRFANKVSLPSTLQNGATMDFDGFLTVDKYTDKNGSEVKRPMVMVTRAGFGTRQPAPAQEEVDGFTAAEEDIPF